MKKIIQMLGGIMVAAVVVIAVIAVYKNKVISELKNTSTKENVKYTDFADEAAFYEAVSYHPVFQYIGTDSKKTDTAYNEVNKTERVSMAYPVLDDIYVTDTKDNYRKTLSEAVQEERIRNVEVTVTTPDKKETSDASYDNENHTLTFTKSGIYLVKVTGKDTYNNRAETEFLIPVETQWKSEKQ